MPVIHAPAGPTHDLGPTRFTSLATPTRGSSRSSVWQVEIDPGTPPTPHSVTSEEIFVVLAGVAAVRLGDEDVANGASRRRRRRPGRGPLRDRGGR